MIVVVGKAYPGFPLQKSTVLGKTLSKWNLILIKGIRREGGCFHLKDAAWRVLGGTV